MDSMRREKEPHGIVRAFSFSVPAPTDPFLLECTNDCTVDDQASRSIMA
jgi:hypothetical protein